MITLQDAFNNNIISAITNNLSTVSEIYLIRIDESRLTKDLNMLINLRIGIFINYYFYLLCFYH